MARMSWSWLLQGQERHYSQRYKSTMHQHVQRQRHCLLLVAYHHQQKPDISIKSVIKKSIQHYWKSLGVLVLAEYTMVNADFLAFLNHFLKSQFDARRTREWVIYSWSVLEILPSLDQSQGQKDIHPKPTRLPARWPIFVLVITRQKDMHSRQYC